MIFRRLILQNIMTAEQPSDFIIDMGMTLFLNHQKVNLQRFGV